MPPVKHIFIDRSLWEISVLYGIADKPAENPEKAKALRSALEASNYPVTIFDTSTIADCKECVSEYVRCPQDTTKSDSEKTCSTSHMFKFLADKTGLKPNEILFIDDTPALVAGAVAMGMNGLETGKDFDQLQKGLEKFGIKIPAPWKALLYEPNRSQIALCDKTKKTLRVIKASIPDDTTVEDEIVRQEIFNCAGVPVKLDIDVISGGKIAISSGAPFGLSTIEPKEFRIIGGREYYKMDVYLGRVYRKEVKRSFPGRDGVPKSTVIVITPSLPKQDFIFYGLRSLGLD